VKDFRKIKNAIDCPENRYKKVDPVRSQFFPPVQGQRNETECDGQNREYKVDSRQKTGFQGLKFML